MKRGTRKIAVFAAMLLCFMMVLASLQPVQAGTQEGTIKLYASTDVLAGFEEQQEKVGDATYHIHSLLREKAEYPNATFEIIAAEDIDDEWCFPEDLFAGSKRLYSAGETVEVLETDHEGICLSNTLPEGRYLVQQRSDKAGYLKADPVSVEVSAETEEVFVHCEADDLVYHPSLEEKDETAEAFGEEKNEVLSEVKGPKLLEENAVYGIYASEPMQVEEETLPVQEEDKTIEKEVAKGTLLGVSKAEDGEVAFTTVLPEGAYRIRKMQTPKAVTTVAKAEDANSVVDHDVEEAETSSSAEGKSAEKKESKKYVLRKTDINGIALEGATFGLYKAGDNEKILKKAVSDKKGMVTFDDLQEGEYVIRELKAPKGYERSNEIKKIRVANDWENQAEHEIRNYVNRTSDEEKAAVKNTKEKEKTKGDAADSKPVKTGDVRIPLWKWVLASVLTFAVMVGFISVCRRRQHSR